MEPHVNARRLFNHATTLKLHTGNLVNRSRLKKKCPSSPSEEHDTHLTTESFANRFSRIIKIESAHNNDSGAKRYDPSASINDVNDQLASCCS